jgi:hypothetical protein
MLHPDKALQGFRKKRRAVALPGALVILGGDGAAQDKLRFPLR